MLQMVSSLVVKGASYGQESFFSKQVAPEAKVVRLEGPRVRSNLLKRPVYR